MGMARKFEKSFKRLLIRALTRVRRTVKTAPGNLVKDDIKRILIVRQHHQMGDMFMALPAFRAVKESIPGVQVGVVASRLNAGVIENNPFVDFVYTFDKKNPFSHLALLRRIRSRKYDMAIALHTISFSITSSFIALLSGARLIAGSSSQKFGHNLSGALYHIELPLPDDSDLKNMNEVEHNLYPLTVLGISTDNFLPEFFPWRNDEIRAEKHMTLLRRRYERIIVVHPGAGKPENIWDPANFAAAAKSIGAGAETVVMVLPGPIDDLEIEKFTRCCTPDVTLIAGTTISEAAAFMKRADLVLCNDTGIMHLASAAGAKTLAVFGPTDPKRWVVARKNLYYVRAAGGDLDSLQPAEVAEKAAEILELGAERNL